MKQFSLLGGSELGTGTDRVQLAPLVHYRSSHLRSVPLPPSLSTRRTGCTDAYTRSHPPIPPRCFPEADPHTAAGPKAVGGGAAPAAGGASAPAAVWLSFGSPRTVPERRGLRCPPAVRHGRGVPTRAAGAASPSAGVERGGRRRGHLNAEQYKK